MITGGAGLVGSHLADQLVQAGVSEVIIFDNLCRGRSENLDEARRLGNVVLVEGDVRDREAVEKAVDGVDFVFHMAAIRLPQCAKNPRLGLEVMADGAFNVIESAAKAGVTKLVGASSASIYGDAEAFPIDERHHPYSNDTLYGASKVFTEGVLAAFRATHGLNYVALRFFNIYGPRMDVHGAYTEVLVRWLERIDTGRPPLILGDGSTTMDLVYVEDIARSCLLAAMSDVSGDALNIATGVETSLTELANELLKAMGSDLDVEFGPAQKAGPVERRRGSTELARERLGFEATVTLQEGLERLIKWWRANAPAAHAGGAQ